MSELLSVVVAFTLLGCIMWLRFKFENSEHQRCKAEFNVAQSEVRLTQVKELLAESKREATALAAELAKHSRCLARVQAAAKGLEWDE